MMEKEIKEPYRTDVGRIDYKFLTPPEKTLFDEFSRFLRRDKVKYYRQHPFVRACFKKSGFTSVCVVAKNDRPYAIYREDKTGRVYDYVSLES